MYRVTAQSSTYYGGVSERAVDGIDDGDYGNNYCTHTDVAGETNPWWRVDLGRGYVVSDVRIANRADCCGDRLSDFEIRVGMCLTVYYIILRCL